MFDENNTYIHTETHNNKCNKLRVESSFLQKRTKDSNNKYKLTENIRVNQKLSVKKRNKARGE